MKERIEIRCPHCSATLKVPKVEGIERKSVRCPVCGEKSPFAKCRRVASEKPKPPTQGTDYTTTPQKKSTSSVVGQLVDMQSGDRHQLACGTNIIGREAASSQATIQLVTRGERLMSREHAVVEVKSVRGGYSHTLSLYKREVNTTTINGTELVYPEKIRLKDGDIIDFSGVKIRFVTPEQETTAI